MTALLFVVLFTILCLVIYLVGVVLKLIKITSRYYEVNNYLINNYQENKAQLNIMQDNFDLIKVKVDMILSKIEKTPTPKPKSKRKYKPLTKEQKQKLRDGIQRRWKRIREAKEASLKTKPQPLPDQKELSV